MTFKELLENEKKKDYFVQLAKFVDYEYQHYTVYPPKPMLFRSLGLTSYDHVRVVILGQDPYHEPQQANGLAFSVHQGVEIPPSLKNIYQECHDDVGIDIPNHGDLTAWAKQGVLLLNNVLSVRAHQANSHAGRGWETFTLEVIKEVNKKESPVVFILWGKNAQAKEQYIDQSKHLVLKSAHPSPLSAYRGFFGSRPFSKANAFLIQHGQEPIDWTIK